MCASISPIVKCRSTARRPCTLTCTSTSCGACRIDMALTFSGGHESELIDFLLASDHDDVTTLPPTLSSTPFYVNSRTLIGGVVGSAHPISVLSRGRWQAATCHFYADVRLRIPMTHHNDAGLQHGPHRHWHHCTRRASTGKVGGSFAGCVVQRGCGARCQFGNLHVHHESRI